jgi:hypothetical protein
MQSRRAVLLIIGIGLHCSAVLIVAILIYATRMMTAFCIVPAALVACASVPAVPGKPINLYVAFGLFVGLSFWIVVSAINQGNWLSLFPPILLVAGGVWLLRAPSWPSLIFSAVTILLNIGLAVLMLSQGPDFDDPMPDRARKSAITSLGFLFLAVAYAGLGFAEALLRNAGGPGRRKKKRRRSAEEDNEG